MNRLSTITAAILTASFFAGQASAAQVTLTDKTIKLIAPAGHCQLQKSRVSDAHILQLLDRPQSPTRLLAMFANCDELKAWRTGKRKTLSRTAQFQVLKSLANVTLPGSRASLIKQFCAAVRQTSETTQRKEFAETRKNLEKDVPTMKINEMHALGVLEETSTACYTGSLTSMRTEYGTRKAVATVIGITVVRGVAIYYLRTVRYKNPASVAGLMSKLKIDMVAFLTANDRLDKHAAR